MPQKISYLQFWTKELKNKARDTCLKNDTSHHSLIELNQLSNQNKVKLGTSFLNRHYFTDTSVSQRIRITVSHNTALLFNIY